MANNRINPRTGKRVAWEEEQHRAKSEDVAEINKHIELLERQQMALEARERFMPFIKFTSPDPEAPNDVKRSRYKNAKHHDATARVIEEVEKGKITFLILVEPPRHGKQIADSVPVLTPKGWTTHGALRVGDDVFGPDGVPVRVLAVSEPSPEKVDVEFTNGEVIRCHPAHEWTVLDRRRAWRTLETRQMQEAGCYTGPRGKRGGRCRFSLPVTQGVEFVAQDLPVDPYTLGVWLGDGTQGKSVINMAAEDRAVWERIEKNGTPVTAEWVHKTTGVVTVNFGGCGKPGTQGPFTAALERAGVLRRKHIPEIYLRASRAQRLELLAGLMDTDGHVERSTGRCRIVSTEPEMVEGVRDLCVTLGYRPYVTQQAPALSSGGVQGRKNVYTIGFQPHDALPTALERKRVTKFAIRRRIGIASITPAPDEMGRCIQVDREDGLYLVGRTLLPTHNSEQVSRRLPAWYVGRHPTENVVVATYNDDFAADFGKDVRGIMKTAQYRQVFPNVVLQRGGAASDRLQTTQGGQLSFVGRGGSLTGRGAHLLIIDDIIKDDKEAQSKAIRDQAWNWFTKVAMSRRMGRKLVILTFTRWHADDPIGRLTDPENPHYNRKLAEKIKIIELPAIAGEDDPLGRKPGEALWPDGPDKFDLEFLEEQRMLDPLGFAALYQGEPSLLDGDLFQRDTIRFYKADELPDDLRIYGASDHAVATGQRNDFTVLLKFGVDKQANIYLLDCFWKRAKSDVVVEALLDMGSGNMRPLVWWAEKGHISKAIGPFLYKRMAERGVYMNIREVTPVGDKAQRAQSIVGRVAMGKLYFPKDASWTDKAVNEMMAFPNGTHDDFVDTLSLIGLGLRGQFAANSNTARKAKEKPRFGTLNWVKLSDKWSRDQRERSAAGGF